MVFGGVLVLAAVCCCVSIEFLNIYLSFRSNPDRAVAGWGLVLQLTISN